MVGDRDAHLLQETSLAFWDGLNSQDLLCRKEKKNDHIFSQPNEPLTNDRGLKGRLTMDHGPGGEGEWMISYPAAVFVACLGLLVRAGLGWVGVQSSLDLLALVVVVVGLALALTEPGGSTGSPIIHQSLRRAIRFLD